jgi:thioredoxin reductase (NADPH)
LDDLLGDWLATAQIPFDGIRVAGTLWSARSHTIKDFLARCQIPYQWLDIEQDAQARALVETVNQNQHRLPIVFFPDGTTLIDPDITTLAEKAGLRTQATQPFYDLIIVGAGPAGLAAAVYGASEGLRTLLIDKETTGGQAGTSSRIENYLGFPKGLSGADLARRATAQATRLGAEILTAQEVTRVRVDDPYRFVTLADGTELSCHALIIATGASLSLLNVPGIETATDAGVYYGAALTEAAYYRGKHMFVVGGANSAGQGAMFLSRYASQVTMLVRGSSLQKGMSQYLVDQINGTENIEVRVRTSVTEVIGTDRLEALVIKNNDTGETETIPAAALFIFIGAKPYSDFVADVVECNKAGFIRTGPDLIRDGQRPKNWRLNRVPFLLETSVPGIFAAGDIRQGAVRRVASAVGQGSTAVTFVHQYLKTV